MDGNTIHIQYIPYLVFINMQCNIRRSYRANNANCNGYHRRLVTRSATAFTLGPVREFFFLFFFYYRITSGNASSSTWPSWPTSRSREHVTSKSVDKLDDDPVSLSLSHTDCMHCLFGVIAAASFSYSCSLTALATRHVQFIIRIFCMPSSALSSLLGSYAYALSLSYALFA